MLESSFFAVYLPMTGGYHQVSTLPLHFPEVKMAKDGSLNISEKLQDGYEVVDGRQLPTIAECADRLYTHRNDAIQYFCMSPASEGYSRQVTAEQCKACKVCRGRGSNG